MKTTLTVLEPAGSYAPGIYQMKRNERCTLYKIPSCWCHSTAHPLYAHKTHVLSVCIHKNTFKSHSLPAQQISK